MASIPSHLLPCMYDSSLSQWIMLFYLFIYLLAVWWDSRLPPLSPATHFIKIASLSMPNKNVASILNNSDSYWFSARHLSFIALNFKQKGNNAIIHAWTLRGRQCPFERCHKFINGADIGHGSCSACVVTLEGKHRSTWTNFVSRSGIRLSQTTSKFV